MDQVSDVNENLVEQGQKVPKGNECSSQERRINTLKTAYIFFVLIVLQAVKTMLTGFALFSSIQQNAMDYNKVIGDAMKPVACWKFISEVTIFFIISSAETIIGVLLFVKYPVITVDRLHSHMKFYGILFVIEVNCIGLAVLTLTLPIEIIFLSLFITFNEVAAISISFCNILADNDDITVNPSIPALVTYSKNLPYSTSGIRHF